MDRWLGPSDRPSRWRRGLVPLLVTVLATALLAGCQRSEGTPPSALAANPASGASRPAVDEVVAQLEGRHCRLGVDAPDSCQPRAKRGAMHALLARHEDRWTCPTAAARCLAAMGPDAQPAIPALLRALASGPDDFDTGDGVIPVRSSVIEALGRIGDAGVAEVLGKTATEPRYALAALQALRDLGPRARSQSELIATVLEGRIADTAGRDQACRHAVALLDQRLAVKAVADRLQKEHPERTRFTLPPADIEAAVQALDRGSEDYLRDREGVCRDAVGGAAVEALAALDCAPCWGHVLTASREPAVALDAVWALARATQRPPGTEAALQAVLDSGRHGPLAREAARQALRPATPRGRPR